MTRWQKRIGLKSLEKMREAVKERLTKDYGAQSRAQAQARSARPARYLASVHLAADAGRRGVQEGVEPGEVGSQFAEPHLRGRRDDRGSRACGLPQNRRPPRPSRPGARRNRRAQQHQGHRRGAAPRADERGPPVPGQEQQVWEYYRKNPRRWRSCARRSTRKRWWISFSSSPQVTDKAVTTDELFKDEDEAAAAPAP